MKRKVKRHTPPVSDDPRYRYLPLTRGLNTLIDAELFDWANQWNWAAFEGDLTFYAGRNKQLSESNDRGWVGLHRAIYAKLHGPIPYGMEIDHANRNGLDNRGKNLRAATDRAQNWNRSIRSNNKSGFIGVDWSKLHSKWRARARDNRGRRKHLGLFDDPFSAAWVYDKFVNQTRGKFASHNNLTDRRQQQLPFAIERRVRPYFYVAA